MNNYIPNISCFADLCEYMNDGTPTYWCFGKIQAGFDLLVRIDSKFNFYNNDTRTLIEETVCNNLYMFDVEPTNKFYYPNDNMFSGDNSEHNINGYIITLKEKYRT